MNGREIAELAAFVAVFWTACAFASAAVVWLGGLVWDGVVEGSRVGRGKGRRGTGAALRRWKGRYSVGKPRGRASRGLESSGRS